MAATYHVDGSVVSSGDGTIGSPFKTIGAAITQATNGDTISIAAGTYAETLQVAEALTFVGNGTVTIAPDITTSAVVALSGTITAVAFENIAIDGDGKGRIGIELLSGANVAALSLTDVTIREVTDYGILTRPNTLQGLEIDGGTFAANGTSTVSGATHIHLWGFTGDATLTDVTVTGADSLSPTSATNPEYGIQFTGLINENLDDTTSPAMGEVVLDNVVVTGGFGKNAFGIFNYADIDGFSVGEGGLDLSTAVTGWGPVLNIDGITADYDAGAFGIDLPATGVPTELQGDKLVQTADAEDRDQEITGTDAADRMMGKGGSDTLHGGNGNDEIYGHDKPGEAQTVDGGDDHLFGDAGADSLYGGNGNDYLDGGAGSDRLHGGNGGVDTALFDGDAEIAFEGGQWVVHDGADTDTLAGVERVEIGETVYLLVDSLAGAGGFASVATALVAAAGGDTILLAPGEHAGGFTIDKSVTLLGLDGAVIEGGFSSTNSFSLGSTTVGEWLKTAAAYTGGPAGITIAADDVTLRNLAINDFGVGVEMESNDGLTIDDVAITNTVSGIRKRSGVDIDVTNFTLTGGEIADSYIGIDVYATAGGSFDGVTIDGTSFRDLTVKGIYVEQLSDAQITGISMETVGEFGRGPAFGTPTGLTGAGLDINLKYGDYAGITVEDFTFTDVGRSDKDGGGDGDPNGGAIVIRARDDSPSYSGQPATLENVTIRDGSIDGTSTGIRMGEPGKVNLGPEGFQVENVTISGAELGDYDNRTAEVLAVEGTSSADHMTTNASATGRFAMDGAGGADTVHGGPAADTLDGGPGSDSLLGGNGTDVAVYDTGATVAFESGKWVVHDGIDTDTLAGVEKVAIGSATYVLVDTLAGAGGFASLSAGLAAATAGDNVLLAPGTYTGVANLTVDKSVTIDGAGAGVVIDGTLSELNTIAGSTADWLETATSIAGAGTGLTIAADDVTLSDLTIRDYSIGIALGGGENTRLEDVILEDNVTGIRKGTAVVVSGFTMEDGAIRDGGLGVAIFGAVGAGQFSDVTVDGTEFEGLIYKGFYAEQLDNATLTGIAMTDVGEFGTGADTTTFGGTLGAFGNGIDLNLKYGNYTDILIEDFDFNSVGSSDGGGTPHAGGGAIVVKARDDASSYNTNPATLDGLTIRDGSIDGTGTAAIRIGEPGKINTGPTDAVVENVTVTGADAGAFDNRTNSVLTVTGTSGGDGLTVHAAATGSFRFDGAGGADTLLGGKAADTLAGGPASDTVIASGGDDVFTGGGGTDWVKVDAAVLATLPKAFLTFADFVAGEGIDLSLLGSVTEGGSAETLVTGQYVVTASEVSGAWHHVVEIGVDSIAGSDLQVTLVATQELDVSLAAGVLTFAPAVPEVPHYLDHAFVWSPRGIVGLTAADETGFIETALALPPGDGWELAGVGDLDGDGDADLLWWNSDLGGAAVGLVNGATLAVAPASWIGSPAAGWTVAAIVDADGDDTDDLVWTNAGGTAVLVADGASAAGSAVALGGNWTFAGIGAVAGGTSEIVWANATLGGIASSPLATSAGSDWFGVHPGSGWTVAAVADLAGDGRDDVVWWNAGAQVAAVTSFSATAPGGITTYVGAPGAGWTLAGPIDHGAAVDGLFWMRDDGAAGAVTELAVDGGTGAIGKVQDTWIGGPAADWSFVRVLDADGVGDDEILWFSNTFGGYGLQQDPLDFGSTEWLGNVVASDAWRVAYAVDLSPGAGWALSGWGDFDDDGDDDILWWNAGLGGAAWSTVSGSEVGEATWIGFPAAGFGVAAIVDVDDDGIDDLVWASADRSVAVVGDGPSAGGDAVALGGDWKLGGVADVDGEGMRLVWTSDALDGVALSPTGTNLGAEWYPEHPGDGWSLVTAADFLGDGRTDLLWWNASLEGAAFTSNQPSGATDVTAWYGSPGEGWTLIGTGRFDDDATIDLLWQQGEALAVSTLAVDGGGVIGSGDDVWVGTPGANWTFEMLVDSNGDGIDEILWRNDVLGGFALQRDAFDMASLSWLGPLPDGAAAGIDAWRLDSWTHRDVGDFLVAV